jgi:hypothetical protein
MIVSEQTADNAVFSFHGDLIDQGMEDRAQVVLMLRIVDKLLDARSRGADLRGAGAVDGLRAG